ncbi:MAG TPA: ABC transporter substrate-binding protein [Chloroflexota bacterium]|jgi:ABC-type nitrate/sulfonate/bicarbonate transport system substrate-binding protein
MRLLLRRLDLCAALVAVTWSLAACAPTPATSTPTPARAPLALKVALVPAIATAPIIVPAEEGQFVAHGLNVEVVPVTDSNQAILSAATGQFDIINAPMTPATLNAFNRGSTLKIIAAGGTQPPGHGDSTPLIVRSQLIDSGQVRTVADLKGRKIAVSVNPNYKLDKALATVGMTLNDVEVVVMPFPEMVVALSTGAIDAGLLLQPTGAQAVANGVGKILLDDMDQLGQGGLLLANSGFLNQHPEAVTTFLEIYLQSIRRFSDGKIKSDDRALQTLQRYTNIPPEVIRLGPDPYWPADGHVVVDSMRDQQAFYMRTGSTDYAQPLEIDRLIDYDPLESALKDID